MSAEKLEVTARSLGYEAKFETQGAKTENVLTSSISDEVKTFSVFAPCVSNFASYPRLLAVTSSFSDLEVS
jgi:hypothetical protein